MSHTNLYDQCDFELIATAGGVEWLCKEMDQPTRSDRHPANDYQTHASCA